MQLSPKLRQLQQSNFVQKIVMPALLTGLPVAVTALLSTTHGDLSTLTTSEVETALGLGAGAALAYFAGINQHSPGSVSFHSDGSENKLVTKVSAITQAIPGPAADNLKVEVEHK